MEDVQVHLRSVAGFLLLAIAIVACGNKASLAETETLDRYRALWQEKGPSDYEFTYVFGGGCEAERTRVKVVDHEPVSVTVIERGCDPVALEDAPTIDDVFDRLSDFFGSADDVRVTYDPDYGFPASMIVDRDKRTADEEYFIATEDFDPG
ncbi:MAG: DUF6174 domain-containing protein [Acidimicrobiia bacterium]